MALSITVNGGGTFSASMEEGPVSFTASLGAVPGPKGDTGEAGSAGVGVPVGGTTGQVLGKVSSTDYDTAWISNNPFNQTLNTTDGVAFGTIEGTGFVSSGNIALSDTLFFGNGSEQSTALPNGTADGNIVTWNAATSTYQSADNASRAVFMLGTNKTGTTIAKGKAVYVSGATGTHPEITLAQANSELSSSRTIGITAEAIANNAEGRVIVSGRLENVNTNGFSAGDTLYLSPSSAGGFTTTFPTQPNHGVLLGYVTRANANNGVIEVVVKNYQELEEQSDVLLTSKTNNDLLAYESSSGLWKNKSFATLGLALTSDLSAYLTTSAAASTYAPLASPALTGTPTAPTAAAATNTTQIATTAFVQQEVPAASTTVAGKVELATEAETKTGTSTTLATTPSGVFNLRYHLNTDEQEFTNVVWLTATSGGGQATNQRLAKFMNAFTTTGYGVVYIDLVNSSIGNNASSAIDWSKKQVYSCRVAINPLPSNNNTVLRIQVGKASTSGVAGDIGVRGIGIKMSGNNAMVLMAHDGTNLSTSTTSFTPTANQCFELRLESDGAGNVTAFVNNSSIGTMTGGPTTRSGSANQNGVHLENENLGSVTTGSQLYTTAHRFDFGT